MKKGSSGNRKRPPQPPQAPASRYPTRDNVYSLQQERQRRQRQEAQQARARQQYQTGYGQKAQPATKKKNRKRKNSNMIMPLIVFAIIAIYLIGQIASLASKHDEINVETVAYGTIDTPEVYTGLILRDEYVVTSTRSSRSMRCWISSIKSSI